MDEKHRWLKRFIDDMILACVISKSEANDFMTWLNSLWPGIKFTHEWCDKEANFLDIKIIMEDNKIKTDMFIKPTNKQLYLDYRSNHPPHTFKSIVYSQALRVKMICSEQEYVDKHLENLKNKFMARKYPESMIMEQFSKVLAKDRASLLKPRTYPHEGSLTSQNKKKFVPFFIFTFNRHNPKVKDWFKEEQYILQIDPKLKGIFPNLPGIAYRQPPNNKQRLVKSRFRELPYDEEQTIIVPGCKKCPRKRCVVCKSMKESTTFTSTRSGRTYKMRHALNCRSSWLI